MSTMVLRHHGINGQRWHKRNGPPYPLRIEDHSASEKKANWHESLDKDSETREKIIDSEFTEHKSTGNNGAKNQNGKKEDKVTVNELNNAKNAANTAKNSIDELRKTIDKTGKKKYDLSEMTNKDLQDAITRYNLEQKYTEIANAKNVNKGKTYALKTLDVVGTSLSLAGTALSIAVAIKQLKS